MHKNSNTLDESYLFESSGYRTLDESGSVFNQSFLEPREETQNIDKGLEKEIRTLRIEVNHFNEILNRLNIDGYNNALKSEEEAKKLIDQNFDNLKSKINSDLNKLIPSKKLELTTKKDSNKKNDLFDRYKDNVELAKLITQFNSESDQIIDSFKKELHEYIQIDVLKNMTVKKSKDSVINKEEAIENEANIENKQEIQKYYEDLLNKLDQIKKAYINNLSKLFSLAEKNPLVDELFDKLAELKAKSRIFINEWSKNFNENKKDTFDSYEKIENAIKMRLDLSNDLIYLITSIKYLLFDNNIYEFCPAESSTKLGYLYLTQIIDLDLMIKRDLYSIFEISSHERNDDIFHYVKLDVKEILYIWSNRKSKNSLLIYESTKISNKSKHENFFVNEIVTKVDDSNNDYILIVSENLLNKMQYLHFFEIKDQKEIVENLSLKKEFSSDYKYLCLDNELVYFFDSQSQTIKAYKYKHNYEADIQITFQNSNLSFKIDFDELIGVKQFLKSNDHYFIRIITNRNHEDYIFVFTNHGELVIKLNIWGEFKIKNNYLIVTQGTSINSYYIDDNFKLASHCQIIKSNNEELEDLSLIINKKTNGFCFKNKSTIF